MKTYALLTLTLAAMLSEAFAHETGKYSAPASSPVPDAVSLDSAGTPKAASEGVPHSETSASVCPFDVLSARERAALWGSMSVRHQDYHWRIMTQEERIELRKQLSSADRKSLKERFLTHNSPQDPEHPHAFNKRLSRRDLMQLRHQIQQAHARQMVEEMLRTPAASEYERQLLKDIEALNEEAHRLLIANLPQVPGASGENTAAPRRMRVRQGFSQPMQMLGSAASLPPCISLTPAGSPVVRSVPCPVKITSFFSVSFTQSTFTEALPVPAPGSASATSADAASNTKASTLPAPLPSSPK